ncbi:hypothetical protein J6590_084754 [Homalodisca vitripennis]|nr:hypothetical protein J6590_084754 [Homalodisca vitripennis]
MWLTALLLIAATSLVAGRCGTLNYFCGPNRPPCCMGFRCMNAGRYHFCVDMWDARLTTSYPILHIMQPLAVPMLQKLCGNNITDRTAIISLCSNCSTFP